MHVLPDIDMVAVVVAVMVIENFHCPLDCLFSGYLGNIVGIREVLPHLVRPGRYCGQLEGYGYKT